MVSTIWCLGHVIVPNHYPVCIFTTIWWCLELWIVHFEFIRPFFWLALSWNFPFLLVQLFIYVRDSHSKLAIWQNIENYRFFGSLTVYLGAEIFSKEEGTRKWRKISFKKYCWYFSAVFPIFQIFVFKNIKTH